MIESTDLKAALDIDGFAIVEGVLDVEEVASLIATLEYFENGSSTLRLKGEAFAMRNLLESIPQVNALAHSTKVHSLVESVLGGEFRPVRGILFDKVDGANWKVPWHQDVTIAVQARVDAEGFGPWSTKSGVVHVQPPASVLENMVSVRLHLDDCGEANGSLRVIPGSHCRGRIPEGQIQAMRAARPEVVCAVASRGALLMRPLLLHASSPSKSPAHRRVIHLDFASSKLPGGMRWHGEAAAIH